MNEAACQVDFYLLTSAELEAERLACRLAMMAWERGHAITVLTVSQQAAEALDELMWSCPAERFLPHAVSRENQPVNAPVKIVTGPLTGESDVIINLTPEALAEPEKCRRLLEIVPFDAADRQASRHKFKHYRERGLNPSHHEIN